MSELKRYAFSDLYEIASGISTTKDQAGNGSPFVSFRTVFNNYFLPEELPDLMETSVVDQDRFSVHRGDIFITRTSETVDELAMSSVALKDYPNATFSGFVKRLRPKTEGIVYDKFIAFYLRSKYFRKLIDCNTIMTLRASFNEDIFSYLYLYLPSYDEQVRIGKFLYSLELKKQLNQKIIDVLEEQMKFIYNYWFVQFDFPDENGNPYKSSGGKMVWNEELKREIPEKWKVGKLGLFISKVSTGLNPRDNFKFVDKGVDYYTVKNLRFDGSLDVSDCDHVDKKAQRIIHERSDISVGDILYASIAPLGRTYLITESPEDWEINESIFAIRPNLDTTTSEFLQMYLKSEYLIKLFEQCSVGSVFKGIRVDMLQNTIVMIPSFDTISKFTEITKPIVLKEHSLWKENKTLTSLRDFLLPLLLNGQVKIEEPKANE